ncbi:hypothetical protein YQE_07300, partial [Dendroctonus ponderosae]
MIARISPLMQLLRKHDRFGQVLQLLLRKFASSNQVSKGNYKQCTITDNMVDPCRPEPSVVIIGAGIAGLSVAQRLAQCGLSKITVLEATDRPGGRIHSCWLGDVVAEMGCQWIHGACVNNPVYTLAAQEGLLKSPLKRTDFSKGLYLTSDGRAIDHTTAMMAYHIFGQIRREAASLFTMGCGKEHGSLLNFFSKMQNICQAFWNLIKIQQELQKFPEDQRYEVSRLMYGLSQRVRFLTGDDLSKVSADNFGSYIAMPGGSVQIPLGFVGECSKVSFGSIDSLHKSAYIFTT